MGSRSDRSREIPRVEPFGQDCHRELEVFDHLATVVIFAVFGKILQFNAGYHISWLNTDNYGAYTHTHAITPIWVIKGGRPFGPLLPTDAGIYRPVRLLRPSFFGCAATTTGED